MANAQKLIIDLSLTKVEYSETREGKLELETGKGSGREIVSRATVFWHGDIGKSTVLFGDFNKRVMVQPAPATQKNIDIQHAAAFTHDIIAALKVAATVHYTDQIKTGAVGIAPEVLADTPAAGEAQ